MEKKECPLVGHALCRKEKCVFWYDEDCSVVVIAQSLKKLAEAS